MTQSMTLVQKLAHYASELRYQDISPEAVLIAKHVLFDSLGTALGGYQTPLGQKAVRYGARMQSGDQATILGSGDGATIAGAAFVNGVLTKILGMDDSHRSGSHIASQVIPAALATAEHHQVSGRDLIVAIVAAYDLAVRVGRTVRYAQRQRGLDMKGTIGSLAAALAAGLCAGLDADRLAHAIALAADMSSGTEQYVYDRALCDTKDLLAGFAARSGIFAVELAQNDFYGPSGALEGEYGFFRAFGPGSHDPAAFENLGQEFSIVTTAFKPHGGCRHTHQAVDAIQQLLKQVQPAPDEIERVVVRTYRYATEPSFRATPEPSSREQAGLSIRVATAVALVRHSAWPQDYTHWDDPEVRRLRRLVEVEVDPEIEKNYPDSNGCRVLVTLTDGKTYEGYTPYAKGEPELPMTQDELKVKFDQLNREILPAGRLDQIYECCMNLENLAAAGDVAALAIVQ